MQVLEKREHVGESQAEQRGGALSPQPQVMGGSLVKELEMVLKLEEIAQLETIIIGGTTDISEDVIAAIARQATIEVEGVAEVGTSSLRRTLAERVTGAERRARGVEVEAGSREAMVDVTMRVTYGYSIPNIIVAARINVADRLLKLCGLVAKEVNVRVAGLDFPKRMPARVK